MSLLAKVNVLQQEAWDICDKEEESPGDDEEVRQILEDAESLYRSSLLKAFKGDYKGLGFQLVLLCGINFDNVRDLRPID